MATLFKLPLLGQTMQEGTILRWLKQEGDAVDASEPLLEVMTDKVDQEVEPAVSGVVRKLLAAEGSTVPVGAPIAVIGTADEPIDALLAELDGATAPAAGARAASEPAAASATPAPPAAAMSPNGEPPAVSPRAREAAGEGGMEWKGLSIPGSGFEGMIVERDVRALLETQRRERPRVTPLAARIAAEHGVEVAGAGAARVRAEDVRRQVGARPGAAPDVQEWRLAGLRKVIAERLTAIYQAAPHVPLRAEVDVTAAAELRRQLQPEAERRGARLTFNDLIAAAVVRGLIQVPALNATFDGETVRQYSSVRLGVAVAQEDRLMVPVLPDAQVHSLLDLSLALRGLRDDTLAGRLSPDAYSGGTFTVTNLGQYGVDSFDPILNPPQVAILGVGRIAERVVAREGAPAVRSTVHLTLTFDHRVIDGAPATRLLGAIKELLENPLRLLL